MYIYSTEPLISYLPLVLQILFLLKCTLYKSQIILHVTCFVGEFVCNLLVSDNAHKYFPYVLVAGIIRSESDETVVLLSPTRQPVGLGKVVQSQDIHGHTIPPGHIKVQIEYVMPGITPPVPMPFDDDELCSGQFAAWPSTLTTSATF